MALNVTRATLRTRVRQRTATQNAENPSDTEINVLINVYVGELYDLLVDAGPPDYYASDTTITTAAGTIAYALPADFRSLITVEAVEDTDRFRPLAPLTDLDRVVYRSPSGVYSVRVRYIPAPPQFTTDSGATGQFDGVSGWDQLITAWCARAVLQSEERETGPIDQEIAHLESRVRHQAAHRHRGMPKAVLDVESIDAWPYPFGSSVDAYQLRAGFIDIFTISPVYP
jgi:hypothetical protein